MKFFNAPLLILCLVFLASSGASGKLVDAKKNAGVEALGKTLERILLDPRTKVKQYDPTGGQGTNAFDGTTFRGPHTYHDLKVNHCEDDPNDPEQRQALGCEKWRPSYVSQHGTADIPDKSDLEAVIGKGHKEEGLTSEEYIEQQQKGDLTEYSVFEVEKKDDPLAKVVYETTEKRGALNLSGLKTLRLKQKYVEQAREVGKRGGETFLSELGENASGNQGNVLLNGLRGRIQAQQLTRSLRNRTLANIAAQRAGLPEIEFELGEMTPSCEAYAQAIDKRLDLAPGAEINGSAKLWSANWDPDPAVIQQRLELCQKMVATGAYEATPEVQRNVLTGPEQRGKGDEQVDISLSKTQMAVIDFVGTEVAGKKLPSGAVIREEDAMAQNTRYQAGGQQFEQGLTKNSEVLESYNQELRSVSEEWQQAAERSDIVRATMPENVAQKMEEFEIQPGEMDMVTLNGLPPGALEDLKSTAIAQNPAYQQSAQIQQGAAPESLFEKSGADLVVTPAQ